MRSVGRNALDLPVAALAGLAVAFLAFAMPGDLMTGLVTASGLPSLLPAAEPPLGFKARIGVGLIGAVATFVLVFMLLRLLDRTGFDAPKAKGAPAAVPQAPRARRRDSHPDAPAPRPISAVREFGEPAPPNPPKHAVPDWLEEQNVTVTFVEEELAPTPVAPVPEPAPEPVADEFEPVAQVSEPVAEAPMPVAEAPASADELMARLERGLERRVRQPSPAPSAPQVFPEPRGDRLQNAINSLQRIATRQP